MKRVVKNQWRMRMALASLSFGVMAGGIMLGAAETAPATAPTPAAAAVAAPAPAANDAKAMAVDHFKKAKALFDQDKFAEATIENDAALALDPTLLDAKVLKKVLATKSTDTSTETATTGTAANGKIRVFTPDQMSRIRLHELNADVDGKGIRGKIPRKAVEDFWNEWMKNDMSGNVTREQHESFIDPGNLSQQIFKMRESSLTKYTDQIQMDSDPASLVTFRNFVQPYVLQNCATSACHGGEKAGSFRVIKHVGTLNPAETLTNFYILTNYVGKAGGKMINRDEPTKSLVTQSGLPRNVALFPHPDVPGFNARFPDEKNDDYKAIVAWVGKLRFPKPNYGITYELPTPPTTTSQPAPK